MDKQDNLLPENVPIDNAIVERRKMPTGILLDSASPSFASIIRVVVVTLLIIFVAGYLQNIIGSLTQLFFMLVLSIFFAYLISPLVSLVRRPFKAYKIEWLMPRALAIVVAYLAVFSIIGIGVSNLAPRVVEQGKEFGSNFPLYAETIKTNLAELNRRFDRLRIPEDVQGEFNAQAVVLGQKVTAIFGTFIFTAFTYLPWLVLIPVLSFFFLKDVNIFRLAVLRLFPAGRLRMRTELVMQDVNRTLAAYVRAQTISCFLIGIVCTIGFYFVGLKYALLLGLLAGIFEFVPLLGPAVIGAIVVATASFSGNPWKGVYVFVFLVVLRLVHDYVTYPRIVRDGGIHLHPVVIILAVLAGEQVAGIPGVFLSLPIVAIFTVAYRHLLEHRGSKNFVSGFIIENEGKIEENRI